ncbi:Trm112 family protein [Paeniglutamicibacter sp. MACA_103]|uniref:Trm112 family protein n=1 Tax=Paeniglutamicibacter sp. MACA_103 TaxID=3377337 RepID=UPI00389552A9
MSNLSAQLIAQLRCPVTGSTLVQHGDTLRSTGTGANGETYSYDIVEGIPVMLATEATTIPAQSLG